MTKRSTSRPKAAPERYPSAIRNGRREQRRKWAMSRRRPTTRRCGTSAVPRRWPSRRGSATAAGTSRRAGERTPHVTYPSIQSAATSICGRHPSNCRQPCGEAQAPSTPSTPSGPPSTHLLTLARFTSRLDGYPTERGSGTHFELAAPGPCSRGRHGRTGNPTASAIARARRRRSAAADELLLNAAGSPTDPGSPTIRQLISPSRTNSDG